MFFYLQMIVKKKKKKNKTTISAETRDSLPFCQDHSLGILFIITIIIIWMMYEDSCFLHPLSFFSQTGKIRSSKCSSTSSRLWFLMASGRRWLAIPPACCRGGEGRERLSGRAALYMQERRSEHKKRLPPTSKTRARSSALGHIQHPNFSHIRSDSVRFIWVGGKGEKVGRDEFSVPAPDQPAGRPQQPAH